MYKILLIIGTISILSSCKSGKVDCDAYADNNSLKKENIKS
jgi:hypothetical protein